MANRLINWKELKNIVIPKKTLLYLCLVLIVLLILLICSVILLITM